VLYPDRDLIIIDFGTATTIEVVSKDKEYLGGAILPGLKISMQALEKNTSRLPSVEIVKPSSSIGKTTTESIQSGLYYGVIGSLKELKHNISEEQFCDSDTLVIGTGGFASLFSKAGLFDEERPNLVLEGLVIAMNMNEEKGRSL
jgi:type III pantothenate kinase